MSFLDKVGNKVEHMKSRQSENSEISAMEKKIKELDNDSDLCSSDIALYYWNLYAKGELDPPADILDKFKKIESNNNEVLALQKGIEDRRVAGEEERKQIDKDTADRIAQKEADAAERKRQREEAKQIAAEKKEAEKAQVNEEAPAADDQQQ